MGSVSKAHGGHSRVRAAGWLVLGLLLGTLLRGTAVGAQATNRLYGTYSGAPKAFSGNSDGSLNIVAQ